jgi:Na+-transporting NADH:ubiquinone oxidoreductase subunit NqrA
MDHRASTLRAAELAGIELDEDDLALPKTLVPGLIGELRASMR